MTYLTECFYIVTYMLDNEKLTSTTFNKDSSHNSSALSKLWMLKSAQSAQDAVR